MNEQGINQIKRQEGFRSLIYRCPANRLTIGYGRNCEDRGITEKEADYLLRNDLEDFINQVNLKWPWVLSMDEPRRWVIYNMAFNMGLSRLEGFKNFLAACEKGSYEIATAEMINSAWYNQVGSRARELIEQLRQNRFA